MVSLIRKLEATEFAKFAEIAIQAFPANKENTAEFKEKFAANLLQIQENSDTIDFYGFFRNGKLLGGMRLHTFEMNLFGKMIQAGGVGLVAVDLLHKKEKIAKELISFFIRHFREKGASIAMLYPFRTDFYKKMGFGYGTKMYQYKIKPDSFPGGGSKLGLSMLGSDDTEIIKECHNRFARNTHGMILKDDRDIENIFKNPDNRVLGAFEGKELKGYLIFSFEQAGHFLRNNLVARELIYENPKVLESLSSFLHSQGDQIERVIINTQDDMLEYLLSDARNGNDNLIPSVYHEISTAGAGLMYRIINFEALLDDLEGRNFNGVSACFTLNITDSFNSKEPIKLPLALKDGMLAKGEQKERAFEIDIDVSELSSLLVGAVDAATLIRFGKMKVSPQNYETIVENAFRCFEKPICMKAF